MWVLSTNKKLYFTGNIHRLKYFLYLINSLENTITYQIQVPVSLRMPLRMDGLSGLMRGEFSQNQHHLLPCLLFPGVFFFLFVCFNLKRLGEPCRMWFVLL